MLQSVSLLCNILQKSNDAFNKQIIFNKKMRLASQNNPHVITYFRRITCNLLFFIEIRWWFGTQFLQEIERHYTEFGTESSITNQVSFIF